MLRKLFSFKKRRELAELQERISELSKQQSEMGEKIDALSNNYSQIAKQVSELSEKIGENSKKLGILLRSREILRESNDNLRAETKKILEEISGEKQISEVKLGKEELKEIIVNLREGRILPYQKKKAEFVLDILRLLPKKAAIPYHFRRLVQILWNNLSLKWGKEFSQDTCHIALSVIENITDVLSRQEKPGARFYIFNLHSEYYWKVQP